MDIYFYSKVPTHYIDIDVGVCIHSSSYTHTHMWRHALRSMSSFYLSNPGIWLCDARGLTNAPPPAARL